ncbi:MAG: galactose-1-phosphate uridylyltransferase [Candidatus Omnitrophica bacterium]|nr:galactose-1-phosphate uridylyltransferase [Candidatus Omnitrophota bacterium]
MGELRKDPVLGRWVIIATERNKRPDAFVSEKKESPPDNIEKCPFCVGKEKITPPEIYSLRDPNTKPDEPGWRIRVVPNKFPALSIDIPIEKKGFGLHDMMTNFGAHEVVIENTDHHKEIKDQSIDEIVDVISVLQYRIEDLHKDHRFRYILVFKNKGSNAGASLAHPHHQIIALPITPKRVKEELKGANLYFKMKERCIFCDLMEQEKSWGERIIYENDAFISFCPYASRFPFEVCIMPKEHSIDFYDPKIKQDIRSLADILKVILARYNKVLNDPEYNYIIHASPNRFSRTGYWQTIEQDYHWHIELFPKLTKVAGFEWGSGFYINPVSPELAAKYLKEAQV